MLFRSCDARGIAIGPIATFQSWKEKGRNVRKGEKAIELCMPVTCKVKAEDANTGEETCFTRFIFKRNWFVLSQTDGEPYSEPSIPDWDITKALAALNISEIPFDHTDGRVEGFARGRSIAISPLSRNRASVRFHELGHIILGHCAEHEMTDSAERTSRDIAELEAECVAMLCTESLGLPGADESRSYVQGWFKGSAVPERSAQRIFKAADTILKAGHSSIGV